MLKLVVWKLKSYYPLFWLLFQAQYTGPSSSFSVSEEAFVSDNEAVEVSRAFLCPR